MADDFFHESCEETARLFPLAQISYFEAQELVLPHNHNLGIRHIREDVQSSAERSIDMQLDRGYLRPELDYN